MEKTFVVTLVRLVTMSRAGLRQKIGPGIYGSHLFLTSLQLVLAAAAPCGNETSLLVVVGTTVHRVPRPNQKLMKLNKNIRS